MYPASSSAILGGAAQLDQYRAGYPQYTSLLSTHHNFFNFRRFTRVRMRLLLLKQDQISMLEESLDRIDADEECDLFLGCSRRDKNNERQHLLQRLGSTISEYDEMLHQNHRSLCLPSASKREVRNLSNWVQGTSSIARQEISYLDQPDDLLNLGLAPDNALTMIESGVEDIAVFLLSLYHRCSCVFKRKQSQSLNFKAHVFILGPRLRVFSRTLTTCLATLTLLVPVIVLSYITSSRARLIVIVFSVAIFLAVLSLFSRARTVEIFAAGASYAAVLVVFTSGGNNLQCFAVTGE